MSLWQGKSRGNKFGYSVFIWILRNFGVLPAYFLLRFVAGYFFIFSITSSKILFNFYNRRIGLTSFKSLCYIYKNYLNLGHSIIDKVVLMSGIKNNFSFNFDGEDNLHKIVDLKKGGILLSAHIGNWDIAGQLLKRLNTSINIVIFDGEYQKIKQYLNSVTGKSQVNVIIIKDDLSHIYAISDALAKNELICMHADRYVEGNKTLNAVICGEEAKFPMGPFLLAATFKVPVSFVFAIKENKLHYHFYASKIIEYNHPKKENNMQQLLQDFTGEVEIKMRQNPEQWFNYYNFWQK